MIRTYSVQNEPLFHLPLLDLQSDQYALSRYRKPANFAENLVLFHCDSTNIDLIANLKAGGGRARKTAQSTYSSCHDMLRSQILDWSGIFSNRKMEPRSGYNPANEPPVYVWSGNQPCQDKAGGVFGRIWKRTEPNWQSKPGPLAGHPDLLLTLITINVERRSSDSCQLTSRCSTTHMQQ